MVHVEPEIQKQVIRLVLLEGRTYKSVAEEYGLSASIVGRIINNYRKECQYNEMEAENLKLMEETCRLRKENEELRKEADFLKKAAAFFAKGID